MKGNEPTSSETVRRIRALYVKGLTWSEIMAKTGVSSATVSKYTKDLKKRLDKKDIKKNIKKPKKLTSEEREEIIRLHKEGHSRVEIARTLKRPEDSIARVTRKYELDHPERAQVRKPVDIGKVLALRRAHWGVKDIAGDMCLPEWAVQQVIDGTYKGPVLIDQEDEDDDD